MRKQLVGVALASGCLAVASAAGTNDQPAGIEVVVTATRDARNTAQVPASVSVITAEQIEKANYVSVVDALKNLEGVTFRSTAGNASSAEVSMRGFGENSNGRVLILLNGRRLNTPDMAGINWQQIPLANVERIEVIRGANAALYGNYAVGGVINIITRRGTAEPQRTVSVQAGSHGLNVERAGVSASAGKLSYAVNGERTESSGFRDRSGYRTWSAGANLDYDLTDRHSSYLSAAYNHNDYELPGGLTKAQMQQNRRQSVNPDDSAKTDQLNTDFGLKSQLSDAVRTELGLSYMRRMMDSDVTSWSSFYESTIDTIGAAPKVIVDRPLAGRDNRFLAGVDYYRDLVGVDRFADPAHDTKTSSADLTRDTAGLYAHDELNLTDSLLLGAGGRVETLRLSADLGAGALPGDDDVTQDATAFDVSLVQTINEQSKIFTRGGTVFRHPYVDEQVTYIGYGSDQVFTDIDPETGRNYELGAEWRPTRSSRGALTLFLLNMEDEIAWDPIAMRNENLDKTTHQGAEASAGYTFTDICDLSANYTYTDAEFTEGEYDGNDVPLVPNHKASVGLEAFLPLNVTAGAVATYVGESYLGGDKANAGDRLDAHTVLDLSLRYAPARLSGLELTLAMDNAANDHYSDVGYMGFTENAYYPAPGRAYRVGASYRF